MSDGFLFVCIATGLMTFINFICTCIAVSDDKDYAGFLVALEIILVIVFLVSGFFGFNS